MLKEMMGGGEPSDAHLLTSATLSLLLCYNAIFYTF